MFLLVISAQGFLWIIFHVLGIVFGPPEGHFASFVGLLGVLGQHPGSFLGYLGGFLGVLGDALVPKSRQRRPETPPRAAQTPKNEPKRSPRTTKIVTKTTLKSYAFFEFRTIIIKGAQKPPTQFWVVALLLFDGRAAKGWAARTPPQDNQNCYLNDINILCI